MPQLSMHTPLGDLTVSEENGAIVSLDWGWSPMQTETPLLLEARAQLDRYFDGDPLTFDLPLDEGGTNHQRRVWAEIRRVPYGLTASYGEVAYQIGSGPRAVGMACGRNPIPFITPCHRILASGGGLGGYSGADGLATKRALLRLEGYL
jgi:methylated-DNA-[protein]-cysteine S-methyltransferase